ncbi:MAG: hypothetical protein AAF690_06680 [Acidobacteriota bacterium]
MSDTDAPRSRATGPIRTPGPEAGPSPAAETLTPSARSKAEQALGWDEADLDSPDFRELSAPESSSLRTADVEAATPDIGPTSASSLPPVEWALVSTVNGLWALLGPVLWLPVMLREVLVSLLETAHGALTGQQSPRARRRLREASRFVSGRFLDRSGNEAQKGLRRRIKPLRLVFELLWTTTVYAGLLQTFGVVDLPWRSSLDRTLEFWKITIVPLPGAFAGWASSLFERAPAALSDLAALPPLALGTLGAAGLLLTAFGFSLGARRR